jgi:hypothetical protein
MFCRMLGTVNLHGTRGGWMHKEDFIRSSRLHG